MTPTPSCSAATVTLHNELANAVRLTWLAFEGATPTEDAVPPARRWLPPRGRQVLELPTAGGWLLGERLLWRGMIGAGGTASPTHIVRRDTNVSVDVGATTLLAPLPPLTPNGSSYSFVRLLNAETQSVQLCSTPPAPPGVAWRHTAAAHECHGALPASGRRFLRGLHPGTMLLAYEAVWGVRIEATEAAPPREERVNGALPLHAAPYRAAYEAHLRAAERGAEGGEGRVYNLLRESVLLCGPRNHPDELVCKARVGGLEHAPLPRLTAEEAQMQAGLQRGGWRFFALSQAVELQGKGTGRDALRLASPLAPAPAPAPAPAAAAAAAGTGLGFQHRKKAAAAPPPAPPGMWTVHNAREVALRLCELPDSAAAAMVALPGVNDVEEAVASELAGGGVALRCVAEPVAAGQTADVQPPPDTRGTPRGRVLVALRPLQPLPAASDAVAEVSLGGGEDEGGERGGAPGAAAPPAVAPRGAAAPEVAAAAPPRPSARAASCAARYGHEAVSHILGAIERDWVNLTAALAAGQVPLEVPSDMIELGTDADPYPALGLQPWTR